jgi:hypothetical protein
MKFSFTLLLGIWFLGSCARNVTSGGSNDQDQILEYEEDLTNVRPRVVWEKPESDGGAMADETKVTLDAPKNENKAMDTALSKISKYNTTITVMPGYRLQIFAGNSRGSFERAKLYILQNFPELEIYESYSQPTYKIIVGDFLKKMDAERYYSSLVSRFSSAKVLMDEINVQKSFKIN